MPGVSCIQPLPNTACLRPSMLGCLAYFIALEQSLYCHCHFRLVLCQTEAASHPFHPRMGKVCVHHTVVSNGLRANRTLSRLVAKSLSYQHFVHSYFEELLDSAQLPELVVSQL